MASHYVTFRYNGNGTGVSGVPSASTSYFNNTSGQYPYTVYKKLGSAPSRNYYKFKGWARSSGSSSGSSAGSNYSVLIPTADTASVTYDFYATWEHVNVTCTFNANGGSGAPSAITHWGGYSIDIPSTIPTRSGYTFVGWALSADATSASYYAGQQEVPLYGNVTLYAVWSPANSQITSVTSPMPIDGSTQGTLTITRYVSSYTHTVTIQLSSTYKQTFNNVGTSLSFTLPTSWLAGVPNATSASVTVTVTTLNGSTQVGSSVSQTITATVPASVKPTISSVTPTFVNSNPVVDGWGILLQGYSQLQLAVSASAGSGASIQSYTFTGSAISKTVKTASAVTDTLPADGSQTWTVTVTDSRGRTASQTYTETVYTYAAPSIESVTANRSDSTGVTDMTSGTYLHAMGKYVFSSANGNNTVSAVIQYKRHTDSTWTVGQSDAASETWYTFGGGNIDIDKAFDVELVVTDALGMSATYIVVVQSVVGYSFGLKNDRVRFGGVVQKAGFQNDLNLEQNGDAVFNGGFALKNDRVRFGGVVQKPGFQNDLDLEQNGDAVFNGGFALGNTALTEATLAKLLTTDITSSITFGAAWTSTSLTATVSGGRVDIMFVAYAASYLVNTEYTVATIAADYAPRSLEVCTGHTTDANYNPQGLVTVKAYTNGNISVIAQNTNGNYFVVHLSYAI